MKTYFTFYIANKTDTTSVEFRKGIAEYVIFEADNIEEAKKLAITNNVYFGTYHNDNIINSGTNEPMIGDKPFIEKCAGNGLINACVHFSNGIRQWGGV